MADGPLRGAVLTLDIGGPAQGGACVARHEGRTVFVRHALPGESVRAQVTDDRGGSYCFADAVEVLTPSAQRVTPPCPHAGPGRCGGCDWQHASASAQRELKAAVVCEQFRRVAHLDVSGLLENGVEQLPGGLLGWRTRNLYALDASGRLGLRRHRSHDVEPVERCPLGTEQVAGAGDLAGLAGPGVTGIEVVAGDGDTSVLAHRPGPGRQARGRRPPDRVDVVSGPATLRHCALGRHFDVAAGGFWQVHPAALETFAGALLDAVRPAPGERVLDLYAGAGALTAALATAVGAGGLVLGLEWSGRAVADAAANLADLPHASVRRGRVTAASVAASVAASGADTGAETGGVDVVVLDPPRAGAGADVMAAVVGLAPRAVGYLSCDPATLARDVAAAVDAGWRLAAVRAFDAFPMTQHVECLALLEPGPAA